MSDGGVHDYDFIRTRMKDLGLDPFARKNEAEAAPKAAAPPSTKKFTDDGREIGTCYYCQQNTSVCDGSCWC
jgi:hypothetical protein